MTNPSGPVAPFIWVATAVALLLGPHAAAQERLAPLPRSAPVLAEFRLPAAAPSGATQRFAPSSAEGAGRRVRNAALGGVIGAAASVVTCTLISTLIVNSDLDGVSTCTRKGNLMFGGSGAALGATVGALWRPAARTPSGSRSPDSMSPATRDLTAPAALSDSAGLEQLRRQWESAYTTGDAAAMESLYVTNAVRLPYDASAQAGRDAIVAAYRASFATRRFSPTIVLRPLEVLVFGERAAERGVYHETLTPTDAGTQLEENGKYVSLMERDSRGRWRYVWSIFNRDGPARRLDK